MTASGRSPEHEQRIGGRIAALYVVLALLVGAAALFLSVEHRSRPPAAIAGGYDIAAGRQCLGASVDLAQSGRYVDLSNAQSTIGGSLLFRHGTLRGTVDCIGGARRVIDARPTTTGSALTGAIGAQPLQATLQRDPPPAGSPRPIAPTSVTGVYSLSPASACLGGSVTLTSSGSAVRVVSAHKPRGSLRYRAGVLSGTVTCERNGGARTVKGTAAGLTLDLKLSPENGAESAPSAGPSAASSEHVLATRTRTPDQAVIAFFLAVFVVVVFAQLCGSVMPRLGQPRVMGEVLSGILLGPTVFGAIDPQLQGRIFAPDVVPYINVAANLGLIFYIFLIGMEVDLGLLRGRIRMALTVSNTALAVPMVLGLAIAGPLSTILAPAGVKFLAFALFIGISMSITAFPVLARIISERRMLQRPLGALAISAAAIDDVSAWFLIALATAVAGAGTLGGVLGTIGWAIVFCLGMAFVARPVLARAAIAYDELGRVPGLWITAIFAGVLLSAMLTDKIGIAVIFGAFVMGLAMPRHAGLSEEVTRRVQDFVLVLLLPLFFAYTGLRTNVGLLTSGPLLLITLGLIAVAIAGKYGGTLVAARVLRLPWRQSAALGALMNTRGLTELIVLNLALTLGVISAALFAALVVMALVTTFMAGPILRLIDPRNEFGAPPEAELAASHAPRVAGVAPAGGAILVAPQNAAALDQLLALAAPLAQADPPREIILASLVRPPRGSEIRGGLQSEQRRLAAASELTDRAQERLAGQGIPARSVVFTSADTGHDVARLAMTDGIALVLIDGRRPLLGDGVPREGVGDVLESAPSDVAVVVAREGTQLTPQSGGIVMVPFGGGDNDWAALEIAAAVCASTGASLRLLGARSPEGQGDVRSLLSNAALLVRQYAGIDAEPVVTEPGREAVLAAAGSAQLLLVGLSDRWQSEGLGETRRAIARAAPAPIVFVRRGEQRGELSPSRTVTRYRWSQI